MLDAQVFAHLPSFRRPPSEDGEILIIQAESELHQEQDQPWHGKSKTDLEFPQKRTCFEIEAWKMP